MSSLLWNEIRLEIVLGVLHSYFSWPVDFSIFFFGNWASIFLFVCSVICIFFFSIGFLPLYVQKKKSVVSGG